MSSGALRVGVTGATGAIGRMLLRHLVEHRDLRLSVLVRRPTRLPRESVRTVLGTLADAAAVEDLVAGSDVVLHLAAKNPPEGASDDRARAEFFLSNALGTAGLAELCRVHGTRIVHASSVAVYELSAEREGTFAEDEDLHITRESESWLKEARRTFGELSARWADQGALDLERETERFLNSVPLPKEVDAYALSKYLAEGWIDDRQHAILRIGDVYGPGHEERGLLSGCLRALMRGRETVVDFGPRALVSFVFIEDVLRALFRVLQIGHPWVSGIVNVANPDVKTAEELAVLLGELTEGEAVRGPVTPLHRSDASSRQFETHKMRHLGIHPTPLPTGLSATWDYLQLPPEDQERYAFRSLKP